MSYFRAFPQTDDHKPEPLIWDYLTEDQRALASDDQNDTKRVGAAYSNIEQTMTFTANLNRTRNFQIALYFVDWEDEGNSQAVEMFDAKTLNLISPVKKIDDYKGGKYLIYNYNKSVTCLFSI